MEYRQIIDPIVMFVGITYAFCVVVHALLRYRMLREPGAEEVRRSTVAAECAERRLASLRWGPPSIALSIGFLALDWLDADNLSPLAFAVLLGAAGLSQLGHFALTRSHGTTWPRWRAGRRARTASYPPAPAPRTGSYVAVRHFHVTCRHNHEAKPTIPRCTFPVHNRGAALRGTSRRRGTL